jgi:hypothetical protein
VEEFMLVEYMQIFMNQKADQGYVPLYVQTPLR